MADIANQLQGAVEGLDRFLEALDNSSMKLGSNAAIESKLARAAQKKADQDLRFRKKIEKMEKETAKREAAHLAQLKAMEPFRKKAFTALKQEIKSKTDLIKQTKGLGDALKKTGAGLGGMFKSLGEGISKAMSGLGKGFKGGISAGLGGIIDNLKEVNILGVSAGKIIGAIAAGVKTVYDITMSYRKLQQDIARQTGQFVDNQGKITESAKAYQNQVMETYNTLGLYGYSLKETVKMTQDLRETFGDVSYVTSDLVKASAELQISYRMADTEANNLIESTERAGFGARDFHKTMKETALVMGADVGMAMRDAAKNSQMIELYAGRGEEYFARMATRATMLGTSMSALEKSGETFADFESASEAIGRMSQLFGAEFADGLKDMTELRLMYERGDTLGLQEHITMQTAKTLEFENGILKSRKTGEQLWMSQIKAHAEVMKTDEITAKRMLESGALLNEMRKEGFSLDAKGNEDLKKAYASEFDFVMAMKGATKKTNEEIMATLQSKGGLKELMKLSREEIAKRQEEAAAAADLPKQTIASMDALTKAMNQVTQGITATAVNVGEQMNQVLDPYIERVTTATGKMSTALRDGLKDFVKGDDKSITKLADVFKTAGGQGLEGAFPDIFAPGSTTNQSFAGMVERGLVGALGGEEGQGLWDLMKTRMEQAWDYGVEKFNNMLLDGWVVLENIFDKVSVDLLSAADDFWGGMDADEENQRRSALKTRQEGRLAGRELEKEMQKIDPNWKEGDPILTPPIKLPGSAKGWAGAAHRGIVGEAGTEVGITRSALRELASAGIPGYQGGYAGGTRASRSNLFQAPGSHDARAHRAADNRAVGEAYRAPQQRFLDNLQRNQYDFLDNQEDLNEDEAYMRFRSQKEFFVKYPAIVDEAFGKSFRERGGAAEGIYNAIFSGMQAGVRAEFAGASAERQREIAFQHAVAEGIKEGGIINQGLDKLAKWSEKIYNNGKDITKADRAQIGLLGGIQQGMQAMAGVIASGGSREQALEMGKRGAVGGIVQSLTASFGGKADQGFLDNMNMMGYLIGAKKLPTGTGRNTGEMITEAFNRTEQTFQRQGRGLDWGGLNARGRVFNSPHLAVVGEGSQNEIIVPTERIRKGLPINEGVARELGSIGVPGYENGGFWSDFKTGQSVYDYQAQSGDMMGGHRGFGVGGRLGHSYQKMGGWQGGMATAGLQFANTYMQTGDMGQAAGQALGAGIGMGATVALSAIPGVGPIIGPILGPMIGSFIGGKLGGLFGYKPKYKKYRNRTLKLLEDHVLTEGLWDHGQPSGAKNLIEKAISGGKKKHPSEKHFEKLKDAVSSSKVLKYGFKGTGVNAETLLAVLSGQVENTAQKDELYARLNNAFYGAPLPMASGGIVTRPTNAVVGEAGPEAVIPLDQHGGYASRQQMQDQKDMISELKKQNQQMGMFIKNMGDAKTVLNVDGRQLAETVGQNMYEINTGI